MEARERIRKYGVDEECVSEKLTRIKRMTAASIFLNEETLLEQGVLANNESGYDTQISKEQETEQNKAITYRQMLQESATILALNLDSKTWIISQLNIVLKLLKTKDDSSIPTRKADICAR